MKFKARLAQLIWSAARCTTFVPLRNLVSTLTHLHTPLTHIQINYKCVQNAALYHRVYLIIMQAHSEQMKEQICVACVAKKCPSRVNSGNSRLLSIVLPTGMHTHIEKKKPLNQRPLTNCFLVHFFPREKRQLKIQKVFLHWFWGLQWNAKVFFF